MHVVFRTHIQGPRSSGELDRARGQAQSSLSGSWSIGQWDWKIGGISWIGNKRARESKACPRAWVNLWRSRFMGWTISIAISRWPLESTGYLEQTSELTRIRVLCKVLDRYCYHLHLYMSRILLGICLYEILSNAFDSEYHSSLESWSVCSSTLQE